MKIILLIFLNLIACKSSHTNLSNTNSNTALTLSADTNPVKSFSIINSATHATQSYVLEKSITYQLSSPFAFLTRDLIEESVRTESNFADFSSTGTLFNISILSAPKSSCFPVSILGKVTAANSVRLVIVSSFSEKKPTVLSSLQDLGEFEYCEQSGNVRITVADNDSNTILMYYFQQRGLVLSGRLGITDSSLSESLSRSSKGKSEASSSFTTSSKREGSASLSAEELERMEHPHGISHAEEGLIHVHNPEPESIISRSSVRETFSSLQERSLNERLYGNLIDREAYERLHLDLDKKTSWLNPFSYLHRTRVLGEGSYAQVFKVKIGSKYYAVRREIRDPKMNSVLFMQNAAKNRMNFLMHNEFARVYPDAEFLQTHLSFFTENEFVTITEFKSGGDMYDAMDNLSEHLRNRCLNSLRNQVLIYQKGTKITVDGNDYKMYFFHGDIKPDNSIVNSDGTAASFVDFGFSRVILQDNEDRYLQMLPSSDSNFILEPLHISSGTQHNLVGTLPFTSPEIYSLISRGFYKIEDRKAFIALMNADAYAENMMNFVLVKKIFPPHVDFIMREITDAGSINSYKTNGDSMNSNQHALAVWIRYMIGFPMKFEEMRHILLPGVFYNAETLEEAVRLFFSAYNFRRRP